MSIRGTEFDSDFANDTTADVVLGVGWDCEQSRNAFSESFNAWLDLVGEGFGHNAVFTRAGTDVELLCKDINGNYYRDKEFDNWVNVRAAVYP